MAVLVNSNLTNRPNVGPPSTTMAQHIINDNMSGSYDITLNHHDHGGPDYIQANKLHF